MNRALAKRLAKLETASEPKAPPVPNVLHVEPGETIAEAARRFDAQYPKRLKQHRLLVVPRRDQTAEDDADFAVRFEAQQRRSLAEAQSVRKKEEDEC